MKSYEQMVDLFERTNDRFIRNDHSLLSTNVNERTLCGAFMLHLRDQIQSDDSFHGYYTDVEYNRNRGSIKKVKTIYSPENKEIRVNCDLILHSRGEHPEQDNLIALEMKKATRRKEEKDSDRIRLMALTADSFDGFWSFDGHSLPEHVCRYLLGVFYEIDTKNKAIKIEYYHKSALEKQYCLYYE